jgi:hypothetical protein
MWGRASAGQLERFRDFITHLIEITLSCFVEDLGGKIAKYFAMRAFCDLFSQLAGIPEFHQRWRGFAMTANTKHRPVLLVSCSDDIFGIPWIRNKFS